MVTARNSASADRGAQLQLGPQWNGYLTLVRKSVPNGGYRLSLRPDPTQSGRRRRDEADVQWSSYAAGPAAAGSSA